MKICIIGFDNWGYDTYVATALRKRGDIEVNQIKTKHITYANFKARCANFFSKAFFKKNLKYLKRQNFVVQELSKFGHQDQILVINPSAFSHSTLAHLRKHTSRLIAFFYDNFERFPAQDKLHFFDKIYSFDDADVKKYNFELLTNYNYLPFLPKEKQNIQRDVLYITSYDKKRLYQIRILIKKFKELNVKFKIIVAGEKAWKHRLKNIFQNLEISFCKKLISHEELYKQYQSTHALLELMRENQHGLSFRVFEAMALEKKIITDNEKIKQYDFYNPTNILVLNEDFSNLNKDFFEKPYEKLPEEIYQKYTIDNWVKQVFNLK